MVQINFAQKQINAKVVYYGPGMSGKTTNLEVVHQRAPAPNRGDLTSISTDGDRTLFFDYMPLDLGTVAGMRTCFQMYTVPGQVYYNSTRKLVLQGCDGVIFVADSQESMREQNIESLKNLEENLAEYGKSLADMPLIIQYNKRDMPGAVSVETLEADLNQFGAPSFEAVANTGQGVFPTLKALAAVVLKNLSKESSSGGTGAAPVAAAPVAQPQNGAVEEAEQAPQFAAPQAGQAAVDIPAAAVPRQVPVHDSEPVSVPLMETGITPRSEALPNGLSASHTDVASHSGSHPSEANLQPRPNLATSAAPVAVAPAPAVTAVPGRARRPKAQPGGQRTTKRGTTGRKKSAAKAPAQKKGNMLYTTAFVFLAMLVGGVLAKTILSLL
ncbi:MAG: signal recognition particle receptor subunit beta [Planctomycetota bacterium]|jgi:signal recognition particle receptor subunit beta